MTKTIEKQRPLLSLIIPSYNDRDIIHPFYDAIDAVLKGQTRYDWEIIYIDDGSTDGSVNILKQLASQHSEVSFIELARNFGQQKACFTGLKHVHGDVVILLDGDYQYNPSCLQPLADKVMEGFDIVSGIRISRKDPLQMRLTSWIGQYFIRRILKISVGDFGSVKALSRFLVQQMLKY